MTTRRSKPVEAYADTSVYGGCFDAQFISASTMFFDQVRSGRVRLVASAIVEAEVARAPDHVRRLYDSLASFTRVAPLSAPVIHLRNAYISAGVVGESSLDDATHVAVATVEGCEYIVSWNFRHIVHSLRMPKYNAVAVLQGHRPIQIHSPPEVLDYGDA